jgi:TrmH family RNA methyltransferase
MHEQPASSPIPSPPIPSPLITDPDHPLIRQFRSLQTRAGRAATGRYLIEGIRHVARAVDANVAIEQLFIAPSTLASPAGQKLARRLRQSGTPCAKLAPDVYRSLSLAAKPQGIGAVVRQSWLPLGAVRLSQGICWLAAEAIESPGNLGTMLRTGEAMGAAGIILIGRTADPYDPTAVRATMGALFAQKLVRTSARQFAEWSRRRRPTLIGSSPSASRNSRSVRYRKPVIIMVGGEKHGLSKELIDACNALVRIPMIGTGVDSLNVAVAAGILLYEVFDQSRRQGRAQRLQNRTPSPG